MFWLLLISAALLVFVIYVKRHQSYWERKGVPYMKPTFLTGNFTIFRRKSFSEMIMDFYHACPGTRYHGGYMFLNPMVVITDLDLIKQILVKHFDHFTDRRKVVTDDIDPLWGRNLTNASGETWHNLRSTLSPTFTGSKLKTMYHLMDECAQNFVDYFKQQEVEEVEMKDALSRYSNDVIATTAFGLECNSFKDKDNHFFRTGQQINKFDLVTMLRFTIFSIAPTLTKLLDIKVIPPAIAGYFTNLIDDTVKMREEKKVIRPDLIHLMMEAQKGPPSQDEESTDEGFAIRQEAKPKATKYRITKEDMYSQAFIFFLAGFETASTLLSFTLYELALHPELQDRLREEVDSVTDQINYDRLLKLKYLDMVVSETLRRWSPASFTDRVVTKPFTIQPERPGEVALTLEVGSGCMIPIWPIHMDPKYYPEPEKFDPERFNDENKHKILPFTYMPFGAGPRFCIGNRFALLQGKLMLFHIMNNFQVFPVKKTLVPMVFDTAKFAPSAKGGMWLGLKSINK